MCCIYNMILIISVGVRSCENLLFDLFAPFVNHHLTVVEGFVYLSLGSLSSGALMVPEEGQTKSDSNQLSTFTFHIQRN
ncbi:hypothetical protein PFLUV_G00170670 [Perca fluviatilis]|uniref:Uncharacterized protein n=1 Tax=Perca fluviatilis TaxID=8168 RepID=A0A6A5DZT4_PERFL|nr:hypothetical protein PFLUV_G00170670 [Perca fluviatilis]